jgi:molybdopterin-guanine dinucleotide biosynthesis protein A
MVPFPVYILAGGKSSRFGSDKARALVDGLPLITRVASMVRPMASRVTVVADLRDKYADIGLRTIADTEPGQGPLGGLATALGDLQPGEDWLLLVSCDLLLIRSEWIAALSATARPPATAFKGQYWEPLLALYHRSIGPTVAAQLATGHRAMQRLLDATTATALPLPSDWPITPQANTPADLQRFICNQGSEE